MTKAYRLPPLPLLVLLAAAAVPTASFAQATHVHQAIPQPQLERAADLHAMAHGVETSLDSDDQRRAALLHLRSAELRPCGDPEILPSIERAAHLFFYSGDDAEAENTLRKAAIYALRTGNVLAAAESLLRAAWLAERRGDLALVANYVAQVEDLSYSPLLPPEIAQWLRAGNVLPMLPPAAITDSDVDGT